jgi:putative addiction module component (TIGR02574 family)
MNLVELRTLPPAEKLKIVEALWEDIVASGQEVHSPAWHEAELRKTQARFDAGLEKVVDWEDARKELEKRFE